MSDINSPAGGVVSTTPPFRRDLRQVSTQKFASDPTVSVPLLPPAGSLNYVYDDAGDPRTHGRRRVALYYQHDSDYAR